MDLNVTILTNVLTELMSVPRIKFVPTWTDHTNVYVMMVFNELDSSVLVSNSMFGKNTLLHEYLITR